MLTELPDYGVEDDDTFSGRNVKLPMDELAKAVKKSPTVWLGDIQPSVRSDRTVIRSGASLAVPLMQYCPSLAYPPPREDGYWPFVVEDFTSMQNHAVKSVEDGK